MRILIVGAGAIGGYFGARLMAAMRDVTFLVRPRRAEQLRRDGLIVRSPLGDLTLPTPPLTSAETLRDFYGLVILSSKSYDLEASINDFAPAVGPGSQILPLLNGLRHLDVLDARFGAFSAAWRGFHQHWMPMDASTSWGLSTPRRLARAVATLKPTSVPSPMFCGYPVSMRI